MESFPSLLENFLGLLESFLVEEENFLVEEENFLVEEENFLVEEESFPKDIFFSKPREILVKFKQMTNPKGKTYKLLGADGKFYESATKGRFGGHKKLKLYGKLDCQSALGFIAKGQYVKERVFFADEETAIAAGFRPCAKCLPEKYREWKAKQQINLEEHE